jgi:hypothetical protein
MKGNHPKGKGKTFRKPAIKGGKFVKVKERCKTFPYCNQSPEAIQITEALKLQKDTKNNKLVVISDLEGKAAGQETFKNKNILKQNGFEWLNGAWSIDINELDKAKKVISLINKSDYLVEKLDDLEEIVNNAVNTDKKDLLKSKLEQYINDLANITDERAISYEIKRYLNFFAKFHQYSFHNRILIFIQRPDAKKVASFTTWKNKNRKIKQGAKGILILRPLFDDKKLDTLDLTDLEKLENANIDKSTPPKTFKAEYVFDISDTEPMNEKGEIPSEPQWWGDNEPSETADDLFETIKQVAKNIGIKITTSDSKRGEKGYSAGGHINLTSDVEGAARVSTMIHELAHELMHWKDKSKFYIGDENKGNKALLELQAESVSYTVLTHYDIPAKHHATYLALWKANSETIRKNIEIISRVSQFIIDKIDEIMNKENKPDNEKNKTKIDEIINEMINNLG